MRDPVLSERTGVSAMGPNMNLHLYLAYCLAVAILVLIPGPVVTLVVANSLRHGSRTGLVTVAGAGIGNALLLAATAIGLITFFTLLRHIFEVVRWAGALYLIWLGIKAWRSHGAQGAAFSQAAERSWHSAFLQGFLVAITNPKALVFYVAFLPQFVDPKLPLGPQLLILTGTMIVIGLLFDASYALLAGRARNWLTAPGRLRLQRRISGTLLIGVGCTLLLARVGR